MNSDPPVPITLPRPNLGPEPWPSSSGYAGVWIAIGAAILAVLLVVVIRGRRKRNPTSQSAAAPSLVAPFLDSEAMRSIERAERLREALAERLGDSFRARTTEEVERELSKIAALAPEARLKIIAWLRSGDRAKFADPARWGSDHPIVDQGDFDAALGAIAAAGASSTRTGR